MKQIIFLLTIFVSSQVYSQVNLEGKIYDESKNPLQGANVYIKGTYNGTITDNTGSYSIVTSSESDTILVVSFLGYEKQEINISGTNGDLDVYLEELTSQLNEVRITAGSFEASEENRAVMMNPVEIATTASSDGDIYGALSTFPGARKQGETGELIVRGGEVSESKTYIDGMHVSSPYSSSMPNLPSRGRFSPFLFNGVMFSTGGYSAEYGQALSSVLELQTPGLFDEDIASISILNVGAGASVTKRNTRSAYSGELFYGNTYPYFAMASHNLNWTEIPQSFDGRLFLRNKIGKTGMLKTDGFFNYSKSKLDFSNLHFGYNNVLLVNDNELIKTTYNAELGKKWLLKTGIAYNRNFDLTSPDLDNIKEKEATVHVKLSFINYTNKNITLKTGTDINHTGFDFRYSNDTNRFEVKLNVNDYIAAGYFEGDIKLHKKLALRIGLRSEYSTYITKGNIAPRASLAYKVNKTSQFSLSAGQFYQHCKLDYLKYSDELNFESAQHFLFNYQYQKDRYIFRTEIYYKKYRNLVTYVPGSFTEYKDLENNGKGYARGIDVFWKDNSSIANFQYWLSYSLIDSKRLYKDYPDYATPEFVSPHNFSAVAKYWYQRITTQFALTYTFSSGRSYNNPNSIGFMDGKTGSIHDLSGNLSYITTLFKNYTIIHFSVSNILGKEFIYSYSYSKTQNNDGLYTAVPVSNLIRRTIIIGIFISIN